MLAKHVRFFKRYAVSSLPQAQQSLADVESAAQKRAQSADERREALVLLPSSPWAFGEKIDRCSARAS